MGGIWNMSVSVLAHCRLYIFPLTVGIVAGLILANVGGRVVQWSWVKKGSRGGLQFG